MNQTNHNIRDKARTSPISGALYGSSTVSSELEPLHRRSDAVLNRQEFPHFPGRMRVKKLVQNRSISPIRFGSWNIGTLTGKSMEVVDTMMRRRINIMCLQETKWVGEKAKVLDTTGFKLWYTGKIKGKNGVGIIVDKYWMKNVVKVTRIGDRILSLKLVVGRDTINIISAYAPQIGLEAHLKEKFWSDLEGLVQDIPLGESIFIGADLNGHVGKEARQFRGVHGGFGYGELNAAGQSIIDFSVAYDFRIMNTCFRKREEHLITYKSGTSKSQIDYFLVRMSDKKACRNCKVIPGESLTSQHRILVLDVRLQSRNQRVRHVTCPRIKWWQLKGDKQKDFKKKIEEEGTWELESTADIMWNEMTTKVRKIAKEVLGEAKGFGPRDKESWWWNENVQQKVRHKRECFKALHKCNNAENWARYKVARNETKKAVSEARSMAYEEFYRDLGTKKGEQQIYKLAKNRERKTRDVDQVRCIKNEEGRILTTDQDIKDRWESYFYRLFNVEQGSILEAQEKELNLDYYHKI